MYSGPITAHLSAAMSREIGRAIVLFAALDYALHQIIYKTLGIGPKEARLALTDPRAEDKVLLIANLLKLKSVLVAQDLDDLRKRLGDVATQRDRLEQVPIIENRKGIPERVEF